MTVHKWDDLKRERISEPRLAEIGAQVEQEVFEMNLAGTETPIDGITLVRWFRNHARGDRRSPARCRIERGRQRGQDHDG